MVEFRKIHYTQKLFNFIPCDSSKQNQIVEFDQIHIKYFFITSKRNQNH
jgi:hypothetical protein